MKKIYKNFLNLCLASIPLGTVLLSIVLNILPFKIEHLNLLPLITPIVIYYWAVYKPSSLSYITLLGLGIFKDIVENNIFGISALYFILFRAMIYFQRKYIANNSFLVIWAGFIFFISIVLFIPSVLWHFSNDKQTYEITIIFSQWLATSFAYVPIHCLLSRIKN